VLHWDHRYLLRWHVVHVLEGLQETDLDCGLYVQDVRGLTVEFCTLQVSTSRYYLTLHLSFCPCHHAEVLTELFRHPHVFEDDLLDVDPPGVTHLPHIICYLLIDFFPLDQQILKYLHRPSLTYYPQMVLMVTYVICDTLSKMSYTI
jgi:hypothetical protein